MRYIILIVLSLSSFLSASEFSGTGFGTTAKEAKYAALCDLSQSIKSEVSSTFINYKEATSKRLNSKFEGSIKISSNLPIIGAEFELFDHPDSIEALVRLSPSKAKALYAQKLATLYSEIATLDKKSRHTRNGIEKEQILRLLLERLDQYERYRSVAIVIGLKHTKNPPADTARVQSDLLALQSDIDSLKRAASVLAKPFKSYKNIYLYPPKNSQSHEVTPFAKAIRLEVGAQLHTTSSPSEATYFLIGDYILGDHGLLLSYTLVDAARHEYVAAKTVTLPAKAYKGYRAEPKSVNFDRLLHEGVVLSSKLKVAISSNKGSDALLFNEGEEINLLVKLNKMGYYYIVGYTQTDKQHLSYLLELNDAPGDAAFVKFVNADDANRWISLGSFTVEPPFGIESIQVIASNQKITMLPPHRYDNATGYYIIDKKPENGLSKIRGLIRKKSQKKEIAEAVLIFTTMP